MKDTNFDIEIQSDQTHSEKYLRAVARIDAQKRDRERQSYALMMTAAAIGSGAEGKSKMARITNWARNFCILFAFATPNALLIYLVL